MLESLIVPDSKDRFVFLMVLVIALSIRLVMGAVFPGHSTDMGTFMAWANYSAEVGLSQFYSGEIFADYPPGYIIILYLLGLLRGVLQLGSFSWEFMLLVKLPSILADLLTAILIYRLAITRMPLRNALLFFLLYAFNPVIILNSTVWGQVDSFFTLFLVLSFVELLEERFERASALFILSALMKPQALIFTPILLFILISKANILIFIRCLAVGMCVFLFVLLPFSIGRGIGWVFELYRETLASYPYASLNASNVFLLTGGNWKHDSTPFLGLPYNTWGYIFIVFTVFLSGLLFFYGRKKYIFSSTINKILINSSHYSYKNLDKRKRKNFPFLKQRSDQDVNGLLIFFTSFFIITSVFVLTTKMHERYLYPGLVFVLLSFLFSQDRRLLWLYLGFSLTQFLNVGLVLIKSWEGQYHLPSFDPWLVSLSITNIGLFIYVLFIGYDYFLCRKYDSVNNFLNERKG